MASGLLKKRAEAIERLYQLVVDIEEAFAKFVDTFEWADVSKVDLRKEASNMLYQFCENTKNRESILVMTCVKNCKNFRTYSIKLRSRFLFALTAKNEGEANKFYEALLKSHEDFNKQVPVARKTIEDEFRSLLGVAEIETLQTNQKPLSNYGNSS